MGTVLAVIAAFFIADEPKPAEQTSPADQGAYVVERVVFVPMAEQPEENEPIDEPADEANAPADAPAERWTGAVELPGAELGFSIEITRVGDSGWTGSIDIPLQGVKGLPLSRIARTDTELAFVAELPGAPEANWPKWSLTIGEDGSAEGVLRQSGGEFPTAMRLAGEDEDTGPSLPQEPKPPFAYRTEEVRIDTEAGHTLAGTLVLPDSAAFRPPYATAVFITGSGPQDRDETLLGHKPFAVLADHLARRGIASLRCDDRGFGESTGDFASATTLDFVQDARDQVRFLTGRDEVGTIGLIGHSEGGLAAPFVAAGNDDVDWVVLLAGTGVPGREILIEQTRAIQLAGGAEGDFLDEQSTSQNVIFDALLAGDDETLNDELRSLIILQMQANGVEPNDELVAGMIEQQRAMLTQPWFKTFLTLDPRPTLAKVTQPVLVLNGELDLQVLPDQNVPEIEAALGHNDDVEVRVLPGLNHLFQPAETGAPGEYASIEITFDPGALEIISGWIRRR